MRKLKISVMGLICVLPLAATTLCLKQTYSVHFNSNDFYSIKSQQQLVQGASLAVSGSSLLASCTETGESSC